ncbi:MAG: peptidoglycan-binding domain-containing protein [Thiolinea sp.]
MTTLTRQAFLQEMTNKQLNISVAQRDARLSDIDFAALDRDNDGLINGYTEMNALFQVIDDFDVNGSRESLELGSPSQPTAAGRLILALRELVTPAGNLGAGSLRDRALASAFPNGLRGAVRRGDQGQEVVAVQYALGRLGYLRDVCDGKFGGLTEQAVKDFQSQRSLTVTGIVNPALLSALDNAVASLDLRVPAQQTRDPMAYLSSFRRLQLPEIRLNSSAEIFNWDSPAIQQAFGRFVVAYWPVMKQNRVEGDCKNIALFLMDQFRKQLKEDRFVTLPHPVLGRDEGGRNWIVAYNDKTSGLFTRADRLLRNEGIRVNRPGYNAMLNVQALDPQHSMLYGINVHYPRLSANQVARSTTRLFDWNPARDNRGDSSLPEVPVNQLQPGHLIFIDHTGDGRYDHTVTVIQVDRDANNRSRRLVLAVGSYDDVRDNSAATSVEGVGLSIVNTYSEEVTVDLDANGRVVKSEVTYASEPPYIVDSRYSARTTLMEQKRGGTLIVARWG